MSKVERKKKLISRLKDKEYRDAFVSEHIDTGVPFQIKALRNQRHWTQHDLAERTGMAQTRISVLEDPNYNRITLKTLKKLASAFDVGLIVRFVSLGELVEWELNLSPDSLKAFSFEQDQYFSEEMQDINVVGQENEAISASTAEVSPPEAPEKDFELRPSHIPPAFFYDITPDCTTLRLPL
ncbi:MAG: helix-turn-helix transcriptional regulator [Deltaproteobacteria bacterium]|nr:helix-turn-helix transcriptional regulator [Deltaproteobacteria bacterium]MBZ0220047.1 helix-turn-helix domain-containing protein [Deltaproteobacteria bacterium]